MDTFVNILIECYANRGQAGAYRKITEFPDDIDMTIVLLKILTWLKLEYKRYEWSKTKKYVTSKPLKLPPEYEWAENIIWLVNNNAYFGKYFEITKCGLIVNTQICEQEKLKALSVVFENFKTQLIS